MNVVGGATDVTTYFVLRLAATGVEATGLDITTFDLQYVRTGAAPVAKVDATELTAIDSIHADNKAKEVDATDQPGLYRVDWPDAAFIAGVKQVILTVKCATCFTEHMAVEIDTPVDAQKLGGTAQTGNDVGADVNDILTDTGTTLEGHLTDIKGTGFAKDTHSLPQCLTATGFSTHSAADVKTTIEAAGSHLTLIKAVTDVESGVKAAVAALNNLSAAQVNTEVDTALSDYDPPTKAELDSGLAALNDITVAEIIAGIADGNYDLQEMLRIIFAACACKSSGGGSATIKFRDSGDAKDRITATVDADGNRTAMTLDGS